MAKKKQKLPTCATPRQGYVLVAREESDWQTGARRGDWYVAWHEIFDRKKDALAFAKENMWAPPYKAMRGALSAFVR